MKCPACGKSELINKVVLSEFQYQGESFAFDKRLSACSSCDNSFVSQTDSRLNARAIQRVKNKADGLLLGDEIRAFRLKYKLDQIQASKLFGGGPTAFAKYEVDEIAHNVSMDKLLRVCMSNPLILLGLSKEANIQLRAETHQAIAVHELSKPQMTLMRVQLMHTVMQRTVAVHKFATDSKRGESAEKLVKSVASTEKSSGITAAKQWLSAVSKSKGIAAYHE